MKATLRLDYPYFSAELVAYDAQQLPPDEQTAPDGWNLISSYAFDGGTAFLNIISKFQQSATPMDLIDGMDIPAETGVLVVQGSIFNDLTNTWAEALDYIKPRTAGFTVEGEAIGFLIR